MKRGLPFLLLLLLVACGTIHGVRQPTVGATTYPQTNQERLTIAAGTAGTVTVATGNYLTMCSAAGTGTAMTMTVTPCGPHVAATCTAQTAVPIPSGIPLNFTPPIDATTSIGTIADTSTVVFSGTSQYWCNSYQYNP